MSASSPSASTATLNAPPKVAVMTSGGDSAGMNAAVRSVVKMAIFRGCQAYVIREGWEGLVRGNEEEQGEQSAAGVEQVKHGSNAAAAAAVAAAAEASSSTGFVPTYGEGELLKEGVSEAEELGLKGRYIVRVGWDDVRGWLDQGGTLIGTARCAAFRQQDGRLRAAHNLIKHGIDALAVCGGDGSLTGADRLRAEWPELVEKLQASQLISEAQAKRYAHLKIVGLVGSIDNDLAGTDLTIGAPTALSRICEAVDSISSTAASHSRAFVIEVMGRHCGWLALMAGLATGADYCFIPEQPPKGKWEDELCEVLQKHRQVGKRKTIVIVAEGAIDRELNDIKADDIKVVLSDRLGLDTRVTTLGHTQRGGRPVAADRILATLQGVEAVNALLEAKPSTPSYVITIRENKITRAPLMEAVAQTQLVAKRISEKDFDGALALRDPEFDECLRSFQFASKVAEEGDKLPKDKRLTMAIINVGAPAGGMNAATRTFVRYCHARGHRALAIHNGFTGLLEDNVTPLDWLRVDAWATRGGSELGTNRVLPSVDAGGVASKLQQHGIQALLVVGGFEAFLSVKELEERREQYPSFRIPIAAIPATLSNNVPLCEFSLGSDTSLNALVDACDAIKQSASASRNRVFVVETQGGKSGYLAVMGALAAGAVLVYTPEVGINLKMLGRDVDFLKKRFALDVAGKSEGRLVIRSERASEVYTTDFLTRMLKEEGGGQFDARSASLGHTLQGGTPSPLDRTRGTRLAVRCCEFLEEHAWKASAASSPSSSPYDREAQAHTAAIIAIIGSGVVFTSSRDMAKHADMKNRVGKGAWWQKCKDLVELMGGRRGLGGEDDK
ncbi:putative 6-phosphofructokinase [Jaminaea rosea]|uniref:ATP-dependent 6-phosphofructokinase n=1 Tax=Jaminaea rosea TaxID=1569628 RepID=A0A316UXI5_9BASI|nr:putative 6-phosphofructokinase [Jaminaea rosea]PWN29488.1 putative 6-phosphofructokinase [Jaminaea rosea]